MVSEILKLTFNLLRVEVVIKVPNLYLGDIIFFGIGVHRSQWWI